MRLLLAPCARLFCGTSKPEIRFANGAMARSSGFRPKKSWSMSLNKRGNSTSEESPAKGPRYLGVPSVLPHFSAFAIQFHRPVLNVGSDERVPVGQAHGGNGLAEKDVPNRPAVGVVFDHAIVL